MEPFLPHLPFRLALLQPFRSVNSEYFLSGYTPSTEALVSVSFFVITADAAHTEFGLDLFNDRITE